MRINKKGQMVLLLGEREIQWYCRFADGHVEEGQGTEGLPDPGKVNTLLLLPTEQMLLLTVCAGSLQGQIWQMEPFLTEDTAALHIVELMRLEEGRLMAAIDPGLLQMAIRQASDLGYVPQRILPDVIAVPAGKAVWCRERWLVHTSKGERLALSDAVLDALSPAHTHLSSLTRIKESALANIAEGAIRCRATLMRHKCISLRKPLLAMTASLLLLLFSFVLEPLWQGWHAVSAMKDFNQQILARYQYFFPEETPVDPLRQFSKKALEQNATNHTVGFLSLLEQAAPALSLLKINPLRHLSWDANRQQLELTFTQPVPESVRTLMPEEIEVTLKHNQLILGHK